MNNTDIYDKLREVPKEAQKPIQAGRLKGKTDINPMWRIRKLTEQFGVCGFGWRYEITRQWLETSGDEITAHTNINLYVKVGDQWSAAIPGTGGSSFAAKEKSGIYVSDECYKMSLTDAISVSCKALGVGADIYWSSDPSKYDKHRSDLPANEQDLASELNQALEAIGKCKDIPSLEEVWNTFDGLWSDTKFVSEVKKKKLKLSGPAPKLL